MGKGRPTKLTSELSERICSWIASGATHEIAAQSEGVHPTTLSEWLSKGRRGDEPYAAFAEAIANARARAEAEALTDIRHAVTVVGGAEKPDWKAQAWILERTRPERYSLKIEVAAREMAVRDVIDRLREKLSPEAFAGVMAALVDDGGEGGAGEAEAGDVGTH